MNLRRHLDRRSLIKGLVSSTCVFAGRRGDASTPASTLPPRQSGELDLHHIDTGRGNSTLILAPDGTSLLIDAGASLSSLETSSAPRPNSTRSPAEWIVRYARRHGVEDHLDYALLTHLHPDHVGDLGEGLQAAPSGNYRLTGISEVDDLLPITTIIDRGYPLYHDAPPPAMASAQNYIAYLDERTRQSRNVIVANVGATDQIKLPPGIQIQILAANANVWHQPSPAPGTQHNENNFSIALRLTYGRFSYFTGGDLTSDTHDGAAPEQDLETPVVRAAGRTEVACADHHGYFDACGRAFVRALDAQAYIVQAWDIGHPASEQLERMLGAWDGKAVHDVFATGMMPANQIINRRFVPLMKSRGGHIVVRVAKGGETYTIFTLDSSNENDTVTGTFGPYRCRA